MKVRIPISPRTKQRARNALIFALLEIGFKRYTLCLLLGISRQRLDQIIKQKEKREEILKKYKIEDLKDAVKTEEIKKKLEEIDYLLHQELIENKKVRKIKK